MNRFSASPFFIHGRIYYSVLSSWIFFLTLAASSPTGAENDSTCTSQGTCSAAELEQPACGLYLAPSTIPQAGLGVFTAEAKSTGDRVSYGDICFPYIDLYWHNDDFDASEPFQDYVWSGSDMGMGHESNREDVVALCPGLDCLVNGHALSNVGQATLVKEGTYDILDRDPGAGASSPYHADASMVMRGIQPGTELFKMYGINWFRSRARVLGNVPLRSNYNEAEALIGGLFDLKLPGYTSDDSTEASEGLLRDLYEVMVGAVGGASRTLQALPPSFTEAQQARLSGLTELFSRHHSRDVPWLVENGACMDHIRRGGSTLPQAGNGAFASRDLPAGTLITISPLHRLMHFEFFHQYNFTENESDPSVWYRMVDEVVSKQLSYNYCFGDSQSTILLCPYGAGVNYINHLQQRANVKIQWARKFHNSTLVESGGLDDLGRKQKSLLSFEYVATQDIKEGDELFMDYGADWQSAWLTHMVMHKNVSYPNYVSAQRFNKLFHSMPVRTHEQLYYDPYPENLQLRCHGNLKYKPAVMSAEYVWKEVDRGVPCRVLHRFEEDSLDLYTVQMEIYLGVENGKMLPIVDASKTGNDDDSHIWLTRTDVPRTALRFFDRPYTTSLNRPTAFRHPIGMPAGLFPDRWRNLKHY